jgi:hypothetical protein
MASFVACLIFDVLPCDARSWGRAMSRVQSGHHFGASVDVVSSRERADGEGREVVPSRFTAVSSGFNSVVADFTVAATVASRSIILDINDGELPFARFVAARDEFYCDSEWHSLG